MTSNFLFLFLILFFWYYYYGGYMTVDDESIVKVLSLFDKEDIPYIKSDIFLSWVDKNNISFDNQSLQIGKIKIKKLGDNYDRCGK